MTWFKVDDGLWGHPKWLATPPGARALWVTAGSWSANNLTDGVIPRHALPTLGGKPKDAAALVSAGLWVVSEAGWQFHQWNEDGRQPTRESVLAERGKRSAAGKLGGTRSGQVRRSKTEASASNVLKQNRSTSSSKTEAVGVEPPSRPVPNQTPKPLQDLVRRRLFGDAWRKSTTDDELRDLWAVWAETAGPGVDLETELRSWLMHNHATDLRNPSAALLGWLRTAAKRAATTAPGCDQCIRGWAPDEFGQPSEHRCTRCRPHLQAVGAS